MIGKGYTCILVSWILHLLVTFNVKSEFIVFINKNNVDLMTFIKGVSLYVDKQTQFLFGLIFGILKKIIVPPNW